MMVPLQMFFGGSKGIVTLSGESISSTDADSATAVLTLKADGNAYKTEDEVETQIDTTTDFVRPAAFAPFYTCRYANLVGDAITGPTTASEFPQSFRLQRVVAGVSTATFDVQILRGGTVIETGPYTLTATVS